VVEGGYVLWAYKNCLEVVLFSQLDFIDFVEAESTVVKSFEMGVF
jgi:hypothetical protein